MKLLFRITRDILAVYFILAAAWYTHAQSRYGRSFDRAVSFVIAQEGGYCHDKSWESKYGICSKWYPKINIKSLTEDSAIEIYHRDYWLLAGCEFLDSNLALVIFDGAVMNGVWTAKKLSNGVYDARIMYEKRVSYLTQYLRKHPEDLPYLEGWVFRYLMLGLMLNVPLQKAARPL